MININKDGVEAALNGSKYVVFDFSSPGCAPCKKVPPLLEEIMRELNEVDIKAYEIDITQEPKIAQDFMVLGVPTIIVFKEAKELTRFNSIPKKKKLVPLFN